MMILNLQKKCALGLYKTISALEGLIIKSLMEPSRYVFKHVLDQMTYQYIDTKVCDRIFYQIIKHEISQFFHK